MIILYLSFLIPLVFAIGAVRTNYYPLKVLVTLSCMGIILLGRSFQNRSYEASLFVLAAFVLSMAGDFFLSNRGDETGKKANYFLYGIFFFFLAHGAYLFFSARGGSLRWIPFITLLSLLTLYYILRLYSHLEDLPIKVAIFIYLVISCFSLAFVMGYEGTFIVKTCLTTGIGLILFSDVTIGENDFCKNRYWGKWILPTYYAAHMILTLGLIL